LKSLLYNERVDWQVVFYMDAESNEPVKDFILRQDDGTIAEILHVFKLLRQFNVTLGVPYVKKIGNTGLRELRIKHGSAIYRIFFFASGGRKFVLLHAIRKKQDEMSEGDKNLSVQRMNDYKSRC